jgi:nucleoside-diphosphate-sugar epimerase
MTFNITGSNGFIGGYLCKYLTERGHRIIKVNRDLSNLDTSEPYSVINLAAYGNHSSQTCLKEMINVNVHQLVKLIALTRDCIKFYNISTSSVTLPTQTGYSLTKALGELLINKQNNTRYINIRPYSIFGEGEAENRFIPTVIRCLNTGEEMNLEESPTHDFIYIESFIDLLLKGVKNCGSGQSWTNIEVVRFLEEISGKKLKYNKVFGLRPYDTNLWVCPQKNKLKIGFIEGLKKTYDFYSK